jgi:hypothetical protein
MIFWVILLVIACEAVTEIITSSKITDPVRLWWKEWTYPADQPPVDTLIHRFKVFIDSLVSCGYCTSVWISGFFAIFAPQIFGVVFVNWLVMTFAIHRLSNWLHVIYERVRRGRVFEIDVNLTENKDGIIG